MSIIHDALKRAQNEFNKDNDKSSDIKKTETPEIYEKLKTKTTPPIKNTEHQEPQQQIQTTSTQEKTLPNTRKKKLNVTFISLIAVFSLFIGVFISFLIVLLNQSSTRAKVDKTTPEQAFSSKISPLKKVTTPKTSVQKNNLVLSGTMMMGEKRVALINGEIYELDESIRGKKITNVTLKNVELTDENGAKTTLSVRRSN